MPGHAGADQAAAEAAAHARQGRRRAARAGCQPLPHGRLARYLKEQGDYEVFNVTYPSTQGDIAAHAKRLAHIIDNLDGIEGINFVAHSLGNIVIRHYLGDQTDPANGRRPDPRIKRFVMLAPPNHGSLMAQAATDAKLGPLLAGEVVEQLGRDWPRLDGKLATPTCQFGIIAGGKGDAHGYNLLLPGDNDGVIGVDTARLAGAADLRPGARPAPVHHARPQSPAIHVAILAARLLCFTATATIDQVVAGD